MLWVPLLVIRCGTGIFAAGLVVAFAVTFVSLKQKGSTTSSLAANGQPNPLFATVANALLAGVVCGI